MIEIPVECQNIIIGGNPPAVSRIAQGIQQDVQKIRIVHRPQDGEFLGWPEGKRGDSRPLPFSFRNHSIDPRSLGCQPRLDQDVRRRQGTTHENKHCHTGKGRQHQPLERKAPRRSSWISSHDDPPRVRHDRVEIARTVRSEDKEKGVGKRQAGFTSPRLPCITQAGLRAYRLGNDPPAPSLRKEKGFQSPWDCPAVTRIGENPSPPLFLPGRRRRWNID